MIGLPPISRSTRIHQYTFINSRYIKDKTINAAIDRACEQKYAINKFAFIVINIDINPAHVDVNVHPSKLEVKFDDESLVFDAIYYAIKSALEEHNKQTSPFTTIKSVESVDNSAKINQISRDLINNGVIKNNEINPTKRFDFGSIGDSVERNIATNGENNISLHEEITSDILYNASNTQDNMQVENIHDIKTKEEYAENVDVNGIANDGKEEIVYKYIGQVFDTYIIIQIKDTMYIIDQHAAHERLLYEQIKQAYYSKDKQTQLLLIPILVELTKKEMEVVENNLDMFEKSGFMIEVFGENSIKISGVPNIGYDIDYQSMFKDIIDELLGASKTENSEKEFRFLATLACKAAVKGRMKLDKEEQISLIEEMVKLDNPFTCPHGRPTAYEITKYEIEIRFLRK